MISVVVPAYEEESGLMSLFERVSSAAANWNEDYEIIIVDDGSQDQTFAIAAAQARIDPHVKVVSFTRNFGHQAAVTAGLRYSSGDLVAVIDADLQDPPEELIRFIDKCRESYDVVYAIRTKRKEGPLKRLCYSAYYRILARLASLDIPLDSGDFCVMRRPVVDALNALPERNRFVRGLRAWVGYRQVGLTYERQARLAGEPKYTLTKLLKLGLNGVFNFSQKPLQLIMVTGASISGLAFTLAALVLIQYASDVTVFGYNPHQARGWTSLMIALLFFQGVQLFCIGVVGEYVGRVFDEVKGRPEYLVKSVVNLEQPLESMTNHLFKNA